MKKNRFLNYILPIIFIVIIIYGIVNLAVIYHSYSEAEKIYDGLALYVNSEEDASSGEDGAALAEAGFPYIDVDFDALSRINEDFLGWLYFPLLDISYPVVYGDEDFTYLKVAVDKTPSSSGSIFIDWASDPNLEDMTTIFYGHNMRNGTMFGSLKRLRQEPGLVDEDPYFYYYTPTMAYKCRVFAYYLEKYNGNTYLSPENNAGYDKYLQYVLDKNEYTEGTENVDLSHRPQLVTLSTCSGHNTGNRTVVQAVIVSTYEVGSGTVVNEYFESEIRE